MQSVPQSFTLVARGGQDGGRPFRDQLRYAVRGYDPKDPRAIHINPATTLLAGWLHDHPAATKVEATRSVAQFLQIPHALDLEADLRATDAFFSGATFMREAKTAGGVGPFVERLETELTAGKTHAFLRARLSGSRTLQQFDPTTSGLGAAITPLQSLQALSGAVSIASGIVSLVRGGQQSDAIAEIEGQLQQLETQFTQFQAELTKLEQLLDHAAYDNAVGPLAQLETRVQITFPLYQFMLQSAIGSQAQRDAAIQAFVASIYDPSVNGADWRDAFRGGSDGIGLSGVYSHLMPLGNQTGALAAWTQMRGLGTVRFIDATSQANAAWAITYWSNLQAETLAINLAYEDAINNGPNPPSTPVSMNTAQDTASFAGANVETVEQTCSPTGTTSGTNLLLNEFNTSGACVTAVPADTFIDQSTGVMWGYPQPSEIEGDALDNGVADYSSPLALSGWGLPTISQIDAMSPQDIANLGATTGDNLAFIAGLLQNDPTVMWTSTYGKCSDYYPQCPTRRKTYDVATGNIGNACAASNCAGPYTGRIPPALLNALFARSIASGEGPYAP